MVVAKFSEILIPGRLYETCFIVSVFSPWKIFIISLFTSALVCVFFSSLCQALRLPFNLEAHTIWLLSVLSMFYIFELELLGWFSDFLTYTFCLLVQLSRGFSKLYLQYSD